MSNTNQQHIDTSHDPHPITWWSWRPGIIPRNAILLGGLITLLAILLGVIALVTLVLSIIDNSSAPLQLSGIVESHTTNSLDGFPRLSIRLHTTGFPTTISPVVSKTAFQAIHDGDTILVGYSPHLHFLYALDANGHQYPLPGTSKADNPIGSVALLLIAIILFPYPTLLTLWGIRDVYSHHSQRHGYCTIKARVVSKRATRPNPTQRNARHPGLTPRFSRSWYGIALDSNEPASLQQIMTFSVNYETYCSVDEGALVQITFSPNLHYLYKLEHL